MSLGIPAPVLGAVTPQWRASTALRVVVSVAAIGVSAASSAVVPILGSDFGDARRQSPQLRGLQEPPPDSAGGFKGAVQLDDMNCMITKISVGNPPQEMRCLIDSGSSDLWVPSKRCESCENERYFHADKSSTFSPFMRRTRKGPRPVGVQIGYGSGTIFGYSVQDTVQMDGVTLKNQTFIIVEEAQLPEHREWDGICGLGWRHLSSGGKPFYKHLQDTGGRPIFSLVPRGGGSNGAYMTVGEEAVSACKSGTLVWAPAESVGPREQRSFWVVSGGIAIHKKTPAKVRFLVDTGSSLMEVPPQVFKSLVKSIIPASLLKMVCGIDPQQGLLLCDCSVLNSKDILPLRVQLGNREFLLQAEQLFKKVPAMKDGQNTEVCMLQVAPNPMVQRNPLGLIGDLLGGGGGHGGVIIGLPPGGAEGEGAPAGNIGADPFGGIGHSSGEQVGQGIPFKMPPFPFPVPFSGEHGGNGGLPFPFGGEDGGEGASPMPFGGSDGQGGDVSMPFGDGGGTSPGEQIQEEIVRLPNGTVCTHTIVRDGDTITSKKTECGPSGTTDGIASLLFPPQRRLQWGGFPIPLPIGVGGGGEGMGGGMPMHDPKDDLWILGGVFLKEFVSIYDFEKERLGFCEHASGAGGSGTQSVSYSEALSDDALHDAAEISEAPSPSLAVGALLVTALSAAAVLTFAYRRGSAVDVHEPFQEVPLVARNGGGSMDGDEESAAVE